jgi:hypothetical protein
VERTGRFTLQKATVIGSVGHAISNHGGILNVVSSTISGNTGCGIVTGTGSQYDYKHAYGHVTVNNSIISDNADCGVGASYNSQPSVIVSHSTIPNNGRYGIGLDYAGVQIGYSTISGSRYAGVPVVDNAFAAIGKSAISGNRAGAVYVCYF